jgi:hypothetical protein
MQYQDPHTSGTGARVLKFDKIQYNVHVSQLYSVNVPPRKSGAVRWAKLTGSGPSIEQVFAVGVFRIV